MTAKYLNELRHQGAVAEIAKLKFPYPGPEGLDFETIVNVPKSKMAVGEDGGKDIFYTCFCYGEVYQHIRRSDFCCGIRAGHVVNV